MSKTNERLRERYGTTTLHPPLRTLVVRIDQADIDLGIKGDCEHCAVVRAVERATGTKTNLADIMLDWILPARVREFIVAFDLGESVTPFEFTMTGRRW